MASTSKTLRSHLADMTKTWGEMIEQMMLTVSVRYILLVAITLVLSLFVGEAIVLNIPSVQKHPTEAIYWGWVVFWASLALPTAVFLDIISRTQNLTQKQAEVSMVAAAIPVLVMQFFGILSYGIVAVLCNVLVIHHFVDLPYFVGVQYLLPKMLAMSLTYSVAVLAVFNIFQLKGILKNLLLSIGVFTSGWIVIILLRYITKC